VVVLPAPFGPTSPAMMPRGTRIESESTARRSPNRLVRSRVSIAAGRGDSVPGEAIGATS
jgi:hypothetical protein